MNRQYLENIQTNVLGVHKENSFIKGLNNFCFNIYKYWKVNFEVRVKEEGIELGISVFVWATEGECKWTFAS